jgi:predicted phage-related endonuclease
VRKFTEIAAEQRSEAWFAARVGRLTGSAAKDMLATVKAGEAAARRDLRARLALERLTGQPQEDAYVNADMQRGIDLEPVAFNAYEALTGVMVQRSGFLAHTDLLVGCSLDGHVGDFDGIVELKVPRSANHLRYLKGGVMPAEHMAQVTHNLWVTGAAWCDFMSFDNRFPGPLQVFRVRVPRDEKVIAAYEKEATAFLLEVAAEYEAVAAMAVA